MSRLLSLFMLLCVPTVALVTADACADGADREPETVQKEGTATIRGTTVRYVSEAGRLPISAMESGELRGRMFHVSYSVAGQDDQRPIMFSWGGGPSGPAIEMNLTYGPKRITDQGEVADNDLSLLPVADLVFVDPVGTGFSRAARPELAQEFYGTRGDARAMAEFIRVWVALHDAEHRPIILNGHSYGVWRAGIAAELLEQSNRRVTALVLTSGGMGLADEFLDAATSPAHRIPDFAATAFSHGRLAPEVGSDETTAWNTADAWAREAYAPALARIDDLPDEEREAVADALALHTGYPRELIDTETLVISTGDFRSAMAPGEGQRINLFDMRIAPGESTSSDTAVIDRARSRYLRVTLGYATDLPYLPVEAGYQPVTDPEYRHVGARWNYDSGDGKPPTDGGPPGKEPWVRRAMDINPGLRVFIEAGVYDALNSCAGNEARLGRMPGAMAANFTLRCYFAGHGSFRDEETHPVLAGDIIEFIEGLTP